MNVFPLMSGKVAPDAVVAVHELERKITDAIREAQELSVPQGFIVAILHAHTHQQTREMIGD